MQQAVGKQGWASGWQAVVKAGEESIRRGICSLWLRRFKTTVDIGFTLRRSRMGLGKRKKPRPLAGALNILERKTGLEPATYGLEGHRSTS